jgi:hypothetical protein
VSEVSWAKVTAVAASQNAAQITLNTPRRGLTARGEITA